MTSTVRSLLSSFALTATLLAAESPVEADGPHATLLALSKREHTLAIVDPATLAILARVPVGDDPHEVVATEDGRFAYVSNYGGGSLHTLSVVDLMNRKALPPVELGALRGPHGLVARGGKIWFTAEGAKVIGSYDPASQTIDWVLGTGQDRTHMLTVASDLTHFATSNVSSGTVSLIEKTVVKPGGPPPGPPGAPHDGPPGGGPPPGPKLDWQQTVITVGGGPEGFDVSPDGKELWVANARDGTVSIIDVAKKAVTQTLNADVPGANRLKFTPDGKRVLIATLRGGILAVIDAASRQTVKRLTLGRGASGILIPPDGARAFVACSPDDTIAVIDLKTLTVTGHLEVGHEPDGMAWAIRP